MGLNSAEPIFLNSMKSEYVEEWEGVTVMEFPYLEDFLTKACPYPFYSWI